MQIRQSLEVLVFGLVCSIAGTASYATTYSVYDSGNSSELLTTCPGDEISRVLYSVNVGPLSVNDILVVDAESELSNPTSNNVDIGTGLVLAASSTATTGRVIGGHNGFNVTNLQFHGVPVKHAVYKIASPTSLQFVNQIVDCEPYSLTVEPDYGRLQVLVIHP
jgi:hypothetical protein